MRSGKYETSSDNDGIEELSERLTQDLRFNIRSLAVYPVLSDDWNEMAKSLDRIGNITDMEKELPKDDKDATLWECEEIALRYILEDGKLNLCLRNLVDFKEYEKELFETNATLEKPARDMMEKFESGMGKLLKNAWLHVEALQTTEIPLLVDHISVILTDSIEHPERLNKKKLKNSQEVVVIYFLLGLCKRMDDIGESRIMPLIMEKNIFALLIAHLQNHWQKFQSEDIHSATEALAIICETEDFQTHLVRFTISKSSYLNSEESEIGLLCIRDEFLEEMLDDAEIRKKLRPLIDVIKDVSRSHERK